VGARFWTNVTASSYAKAIGNSRGLDWCQNTICLKLPILSVIARHKVGYRKPLQTLTV
jgi:hypothetical protein